jgi:hypothetical protein
VTDASGVTVADGVPVQFSLANPTPGISVTSPGFTNELAPCIAGGVPQPGDALSCVKYLRDLGGNSVTINAQVPGTSVSTQQQVTLPLVATPTPTSVPTATATTAAP